MKVRIKFRKYGVMKFIGHLDVMRYFQKAMRRADIPIAFTGGYSPHMIMSFAQPLGIGITSDGEYLDVELKEPVSSREAVDRLNRVMAEGIDIVSFVQIPEEKKYSGMTVVAAAEYRVTLPETVKTSEIIRAVPESWEKQVQEFLAQPEILVMKKTKRSEKEVNIRPMIYEMKVSETEMTLFLATGSEENLKPDLVMQAFLTFIGEDEAQIPLHYHRIDLYARAEMAGEPSQPPVKGKDLLPLDAFGNEVVLGE